nr:T9SS type A sorting domain-containing protein [Bacteroidota bacterium]
MALRPIWTRLHNGALSVWTDVTDLSTLLSNEEIVQTKNDLSFENFPNPSHDYTYVSFKLHTRSKINLTILDMNGKVVSQIILNENRDYGKYIERIDLTKLNLPNGTYLLKLEIDDKVEVQRQIKI